MKLFALLPFLVFPIHLFAQQEKGCTIKDYFRIYYEGGDFSNSKHSFSFTSPGTNSSNLNAQDTLKVENNAHAKIVMHWTYSNQYYDMYYPAYDSVQWFYNDAPLDSSAFSFSSSEHGGSCGMVYNAASKVVADSVGFYQLRYLGSPYGITATYFPVIHVYDKASVLNQPEQEDYISIYPNPVRDKITVELADPKKNLELHIYDLNGSKIESIDLYHHQISSYSLSTMSQGMYLCNLYDPEVSEVVYRIKLKKL